MDVENTVHAAKYDGSSKFKFLRNNFDHVLLTIIRVLTSIALNFTRRFLH